jgi:hypothetical protein
LIADYSKVPGFPEYILYELNENVYAKVPGKNFVRIIDFDLASLNCDKTKIHPFYYSMIEQFKNKIGNCENSGLTERVCGMYNICNNEQYKKFDTYQTFWLIDYAFKLYNKHHSIISWMSNIFDNFKGGRWLSKKDDSTHIMFPNDILLTRFPDFIKSKSQAAYLEDKIKYPIFTLPLDNNFEMKNLDYYIEEAKREFLIPPSQMARPTQQLRPQDLQPRFISEQQHIANAYNPNVWQNPHIKEDEYGERMDITPTLLDF